MTNKNAKKVKRLVLIITVFIAIICLAGSVYADDPVFPFKFGFNVEPAETPEEVNSSIQILLILTVLALAPSILIMLTSFTRVIIILSFLRNALGTQQMPPNQVLIGIALFLTLFIMAPVGKEINENALKPYLNEEITQKEAIDTSSAVIKRFMLKQFRNEKDLGLFISLAGIETPVEDPETLPLTVVIPAFLISELTIAFKIGFLLYIPFLVIDMVVSSTLMSMGMLMLPPILISLPFKVLLFIMAGGWNLVTQAIIGSFTG